MWLASASEPDACPSIAAAARRLAANEVVAFPTETVYGLGGNALSDVAVTRIFEAKGRPSDNPLIVHVASRAQLDALVSEVTPIAEKLIKAFWPGPLSVVLPSSGAVSSLVSAGLDSVGVRMPSHPAALALIRAAGVPLAAPSANTSGRPSPTCALHVQEDLAGRIAGILDGGSTGCGVESTVVDCRGAIAVLLRPGGVTLEEMREVLGDVCVPERKEERVAHGSPAAATAAPRVTPLQQQRGAAETAAEQAEPETGEKKRKLADSEDSDFQPRAPGMKYTHYAPRAPLQLVEGSGAFLQQQVGLARQRGQRVGLLVTEESLAEMQPPQGQKAMADVVIRCGSRDDMKTVAQSLYGCLRSFDAAEPSVDIIFAETFSVKGIGHAVMNRLSKAAGHKVIVESLCESSVA